MQYTKLGRTNVEVSRLCLGTNNFGSQLSEEQAAKVIRRAVDLGISFIDTANVYVDGRSEEIIGNAIKGDRSRVVIATKVGYAMSGDPEGINLSRKSILSKAGDSLRRLKTDHIDLYYLHGFDLSVPLEESLPAMDQLVKDGKVGHVGISNFSAEQLKEATRICEENDLAEPVALQPRYNLMVRDPEKELLPLCEKQGLGVVTYSPLAGGFLTGKYSKGAQPPAGTRGAFNENYWKRYNNDESFAKLERLSKVASDARIPLATLAISWILSKPAVTAPIVGASLPEQVEQNCRVLETKVPSQVYAKLESAL
ncbi:MAG: aldo/keto reductase [Nitrososphaerales archaeon]|nr:aldo/keto reductase [Nitrososphaerales archaeon]